MIEGTVEQPRYFKFLEKGPPDHATPIFGIACDEGWCQSIVCAGMYEWTADWLVETLQGKPFARKYRPGAATAADQAPRTDKTRGVQ